LIENQLASQRLKMPSKISIEAPDDELIATLRAVAGSGDPDQFAWLASEMANSGQIISFGEVATADVASTGGPSSLSTLICPLILRGNQFVVPKLGVPGRPAGGIDVLAQLPGYRSHLSETEVRQVVERCGYAHFLSGNLIAPLDAKLFALRQRHNLQNVPGLAAASILSKKFAVGVKHVGIDARVAPWGNFGTSNEDAQKSAQLLTQVARRLGLEASVVLTDGHLPYQPYIGRSEALVALSKVFDGTANSDLAAHVRLCHSIAYCTIFSKTDPTTEMTGNSLKDHFIANIEAQGSSWAEFEALVRKTESLHTSNILALESGFVRVELGGLRSIFSSVQAQIAATDPFPDPLGVVLEAECGAWVKKGTTLASFRLTEGDVSSVRSALERVIFTTRKSLCGRGFTWEANSEG